MAEKLRQLLNQNGVDAGTIQKVEAQVSQAQKTGKKPGPSASKLMEMAGETFGADLSGVRVHQGPAAAGMNQQLGAKAFTTGQDIFFNQGQYNPGGPGGNALVGHEVTHAVQQSAPGNHAQKQEVKQLASKAAQGH